MLYVSHIHKGDLENGERKTGRLSEVFFSSFLLRRCIQAHLDTSTVCRRRVAITMECKLLNDDMELLCVCCHTHTYSHIYACIYKNIWPVCIAIGDILWWNIESREMPTQNDGNQMHIYAHFSTVQNEWLNETSTAKSNQKGIRNVYARLYIRVYAIITCASEYI